MSLSDHHVRSAKDERELDRILDAIERADWLLWWAARTPVNLHQSLVLAACDCARTALQYVPAGEDRPRLAIEAAERWNDGDYGPGSAMARATASSLKGQSSSTLPPLRATMITSTSAAA